MATNLDRMRALKDTVAIVGIGETDYLKDYRAGARGNVTRST